MADAKPTKPIAPPESQLENMVRVMTDRGKIKYISKHLAQNAQFIRDNNVRILPPDVKVEAFVPEPLRPEKPAPTGGMELPEMQTEDATTTAVDPAGAMDTAPKQPAKRPGGRKPKK